MKKKKLGFPLHAIGCAINTGFRGGGGGYCEIPWNRCRTRIIRNCRDSLINLCPIQWMRCSSSSSRTVLLWWKFYKILNKSNWKPYTEKSGLNYNISIYEYSVRTIICEQIVLFSINFGIQPRRSHHFLKLYYTKRDILLLLL